MVFTIGQNAVMFVDYVNDCKSINGAIRCLN